MTPRIYNAALAVGVAAISVGVGLWSVPAALVTFGSLVLALTLFGAYMTLK